MAQAASRSAATEKRSVGRRQIRGSSLLLAGRLLAKGANFLTHVMIVRYLTQSDYGAFAYALSIAAMGEHAGTFGLHRAISRFVPIYLEKRSYDRAFGTIYLALGVVALFGLLVVLPVHLFQEAIAASLIQDRQAVTMLLILIFLAPINALDTLVNGLFAVFASPRAIFFRRYVVGPALKISVVVVVTSVGLGVHSLAIGYLAAGAVGMLLYGVMLVALLRKQDLWQYASPHQAFVPWREVFSYTLPLLTTDLVYLLINSLCVVLLGYYGGTDDVAVYRAVLPAAMLNQLVFASFHLLFAPQAARLYARDDAQGMNELYWKTASWIAVMTFPIFVVTFSLAKPVALLLFGERYLRSADVLALMAVGYYFHASIGFNGTTLATHGKVRCLFLMNLLVASLSLLASLLLIPRYGVMGAAIATCGTLLAHNFGKQLAMGWYTGVQVFDRRYARVYGVIALGAVGLLVLQRMALEAIYWNLLVAVVVFFFSVRLNRDLLQIDQTFPEIRRVPLVSWLFR